CKIEPDQSIRLGLRVVKVLSNTGANRLLAEKSKSPFLSLDDFRRRVRLNKDELRALAKLGALNCLAAHRRDALWQVERVMHETDLFEDQRPTEAVSPLPAMDYGERVQADFAGMNLTTGKHPMALLRPHLHGIWRAADLPTARHGSIVRIAGNVICRQRPGTA